MMDDLSFLDKLDKSQYVIADKIITKANEVGVDPRLALSLAYTESNFLGNKKGSSGEIGVMQVLPNTAKSLGYDPKDLNDTDKNIQIGLQYLKQGLDRYKDPQLAALAYNAGMDHPFFQGKGSPPASSVEYLNKINGYGGFYKPSEEGSSKDPIDDIIKLKNIQGSGVNVGVEPASDMDFLSAMGLGALGGSLIGSGTKPEPMKAPAQPVRARTPVQNWTGAMGYGDRGAQTYGQAHEFEKGTRKGSAIRSPATGQIFNPSFRFEKPPIIEPSLAQKTISGLRSAGEFLGRNPVATGTLAGAGLAGSAMSAADRLSEGDKVGATIAGLGALGGAAAMVPSPLTRVLGAGMATASPIALAVLDRVRRQNQGYEMTPTPAEMEQAQKPAFAMRRKPV